VVLGACDPYITRVRERERERERDRDRERRERGGIYGGRW